MQICPDCGFQNREGALLCDHCGKGLHSGISYATVLQGPLQQLTDLQVREKAPGTIHLRGGASLELHAADTSTRIALVSGHSVVLGRTAPGKLPRPDVDLTPYSGLEKGVSRIHAAIQRQGDTLTLMDMQSANGTFVNGRRIPPSRPYVLHNGDEIHLGQFRATVHFE